MRSITKVWRYMPNAMERGTLSPKLEILSPPQRLLWNELTSLPPEFVLYGGTAIALQLGHRESVDFDFFGDRPFDPDVVANAIPFLVNAQILQKGENTLTGVVERGGPVQVSFFGLPGLRRLADPLTAADNGIKVASLIDLAAMKVSVVQKRAEAKDYIDLDAMLGVGIVDLPTALAAGMAVYGHGFNPQVTLKALSYFEDGDLPRLPASMKDRLARLAREVDLDRLPDLRAKPSPVEPGRREP